MTEEEKKRAELILALKEALCRYTFFHKKKTPSEVYGVFDFTEKCLTSFVEFLKLLQDNDKDKHIEYINPLSNNVIRFGFDKEPNFYFVDIYPDGTIAGQEIIKNDFKYELVAASKEFIDKI